MRHWAFFSVIWILSWATTPKRHTSCAKRSSQSLFRFGKQTVTVMNAPKRISFFYSHTTRLVSYFQNRPKLDSPQHFHFYLHKRHSIDHVSSYEQWQQGTNASSFCQSDRNGGLPTRNAPGVSLVAFDRRASKARPNVQQRANSLHPQRSSRYP